MSPRPGSVMREAAVRPVLAELARPGIRVLDVGGYDGSVSKSLAGTGVVVVLDVDPKGFPAARARGGVAVVGSGTAIPLARGAFDLAVCCDVLMSLAQEEVEHVYAEIARVLRPGGRLIVTEVDEGFGLPFVDRDRAFAAWGVPPGGFAASRLAALLEGAGFRVTARGQFYGAVTRAAYGVMFVRGWPRRGARVKHRAWRYVVATERWWRPRPRSNLLVAVVPAAPAAPAGSEG